MKVIVISLKSALDRREYMKKILDKHFIEFEFFDALSPDDISVKLIENKPRHLSKEAVATFETHRKVLEFIRDSGELTLILEDDATPFVNDISIKIERLLRTEFEWDVLFIGWTPKSVLNRRTIGVDFLNVDKFIGLHSYIPNPESILKILDNLGEPIDHIDKRLSELGCIGLLKNLFSRKKIFYQNNTKFKTQIPKSKYQ